MSHKTDYLEYQQSLSKPETHSLPDELTTMYGFISVLSKKDDRVIYLAEEKESGAKRIIKATGISSPDSAKREHEFLSGLDYPGIPKAIGYFNNDGTEYLIREYAEGETLDVIVERDGVFDPAAIFNFTHKVCEIVEYLHKQSPPIIFRDIKPANIVVTPGGKVTLIDFGIARHYDKDKSFDTRIVGSVEYASPEQFGFGSTDLRSDVYTLGKLMIFLATGKGDLQEYVKQAPASPLKRIIMKCVRLSPQGRYRSAAGLAKAIGKALNPMTGKQLALGIAASCLVIAVSLIVGRQILNPALLIDEPGLPLSAEGFEANEHAMVPVELEILFDGQPFNNCSVTVDGHNWFAPAADGNAVLEVYPANTYVSRAAYMNRVAEHASPIKPGENLSVTLDIGNTPYADEFISFLLPFGGSGEFLLPVGNAETIDLTNQPSGVDVSQKDGGFYLDVSHDGENIGFFFFTLTARNEYGYATSNVSLFYDDGRQPVEIGTADELNAIRDDLAGSYILTGDIDLSVFGEWLPIGSQQYPFTGILDGNGYTIKGLNIYASASQNDNHYNEFYVLHSGLVAVARNAVIRNLIVRDAYVEARHVGGGRNAVIVGWLINSLLENCAVIGGEISTSIGLTSSIGALCGMNYGFIKSCFNSADIVNTRPDESAFDTLSYFGGICGYSQGVIVSSGNAGSITSISQTGGVAAQGDRNYLTRCYNAGEVSGIVWRGEYPPGSVIHLNTSGSTASYSYFEKGTASVGASVTATGTLISIAPIDKTAFRDISALANLGGFEGDDADWLYASVDSYYPMPAGIFREQAAAPIMPDSGARVTLPAVNGILYFYTLDGQDPYKTGAEGVNSLDVTLQQGQTLTIFTAEEGKYDSDIVIYNAD